MDFNTEQMVSIGYTNYKGEESLRTIVPIRMHFGTNEYYKEPQWIIEAFDVAKRANRSFALARIRQTDDVSSLWRIKTNGVDYDAPAPLSDGMSYAQELAQALAADDDKAVQIAAVNIVGKLIETQDRIAEALEEQAEAIKGVVTYGNYISVRNVDR